ncbi:hypothetical protein B484DRAFT_395510 [Ochromonadaceae sp. CCMP2298]|nr:hypothetical protein B484DRAFT_395510 [Ochromonadaceae sp. CCMP2298]
MNVAIALLSLVLCWLSLTEAEKAAEDAKMPRATIHVGPPKTATSTIQQLMTSAENIARMRAQNTYWPDYGATDTTSEINPISMVNMQRFAIELSDPSRQYQSTTQMREFLFKSRRLGHDVIMSSEFFPALLPLQIHQLKYMLQGFDVTIVFVYREYIAHLISWHYQRYHLFNGHYKPFSKYLMRLDVTEHSRDYITLLEDWQRSD